MSVDLSAGLIPTYYHKLFDMINSHGLNNLTMTIFISLFESTTLTKTILNQIWTLVVKSNSISARNDFYKCLALMGLVEQGKPIDAKLFDSYINRELPTPKLRPIDDIENHFITLLRSEQRKDMLCYRYNDLCSIDTIQIEIEPNKKGILIRHVEYEITSLRQKSKVSRRFNDFVALHELLTMKYPFRIIPMLPPKKTVNVDKQFIEERRRSLKKYLQILCRHPTMCDTDIIKFFLTFQGTSCGDNMKATYKNIPDEFASESTSYIDHIDKQERHDHIQMFRNSQTHIYFIHQHLSLIHESLKNINEKYFKNSDEFSNIEKTFQTLASDTTNVDRWATGPNDYWPTIQIGLDSLPFEMNAISQRIKDQFRRNDEVINEHLDMLIELLQGYKDLCKRLDDSLQNEQKTIQKLNSQQKRSSGTLDNISGKTDPNFDLLERKNRHGLQCVQIETQLVYANLEALVYIINNLGNNQCEDSNDCLKIWKSFSNKISQLGQNYINKSLTQRIGQYNSKR